MSDTARSARVVKVAAGVEDTDRAAPVRDSRHEALGVLIGNWINEGHTIGAGEIPSVPILTSDVYEWAPGGFFVVHSAFGRIGVTPVGGVEIIGVDGDGYRSTFHDSFGNVHVSRLDIEGNVLKWTGDRTRCTVTMTDDGMTQNARHEASPDGRNWAPSMDVTLRRIPLSRNQDPGFADLPATFREPVTPNFPQRSRTRLSQLPRNVVP